MRCPGCSLYHPSHYKKCISCGVSLTEGDRESNIGAESDSDLATSRESVPSDVATAEAEPPHRRRSKELKHKSIAGMPTMAGVFIGVAILLIAAGATTFFLTQTPKDERMLHKGREEISRGQFAFAVDTLTKATALRPGDPRSHLLLARAYVGINDVDKAWESISRAQQLGEGVASEPELASDLANYYMKKKNFERAIGLLRPLAKKDIKGKKSELADLDAAYGDELLAKGKLSEALNCWEEVRDLRAGSRFEEAEARLSTIYEKLATKLSGEKKDDEALNYLSKLSNIAKNPKHLIAMADIYERKNNVELAIEQLRSALKLSNDQSLQRRLAGLLNRRGKELLDDGQNSVGYAYLQQAKSIDPASSVPDVTLKNISVGVDSSSRCPRISGEVWNPGDNSISSLSLRAELFDTTSDRALWSKETRVVDEFVRPLGGRDSQPFRFSAGVPAKFDGTVEFRMYVDGSLYKAYKLENGSRAPSPSVVDATPEPAPAPSRTQSTTGPDTVAPAPAVVKTAPPPAVEAPKQETAPAPGGNPEEKTLRDLEF